MTEIETRLDALYANLDAPACNEGCTKCCSQVPMLPVEADRLGLDYCATPSEDSVCIFAIRGKCTVYNKRPFICRVFNAVSEGCMLCPEMSCHCKLSNDEYEGLFAEYMAILELHSDDDKAKFEIAWEESRSVMAERAIANGW